MSDHASFTVTIPIVEENINSTRFSIAKNSKEETSFIKDVSSLIRNLDMYLALIDLKTLSIHLLRILNMHGRRIPSSLIFQDILRIGGTMSAISV